MALETRIPKEITDYREKIVFGLSSRQLIAIALALAVVLLTALVLWFLLQLPFALVEYILIFEAIPFVAVGFIRYKGMPFEQVARMRWNFRFGQKRLLNQTNLDFLPSLYPISPKRESTRQGGNRHEPDKKIARKEIRNRLKRCECLSGDPDSGSRGKRKKRKRRERRPHSEEEKS